MWYMLCQVTGSFPLEVLTFKAVVDKLWVSKVWYSVGVQEKVTHMAGKEIETNHHDYDHHGHEVFGWHYGCSGNTQIEAKIMITTKDSRIPTIILSILYKITCSLICSTHFSPVWGKLHVVIQVIYVPPAVDINSSICCDDQHHESQFSEVADLHQHGSGDEWHHSHEAVVLRVVRAASVTEWLQNRARGTVEGLKGWRDTAQLQHQRWSAWVIFNIL